VKEIPPKYILPGKTYFIFSHTIKAQPHNREMFREFIRKKSTLIDYECLKDENGKRLIAFGRWAGIVGAYHAIRMAGLRTKAFYIRQMSECHNFAEAQKELAKVRMPSVKIVLSGSGRVSEGADFLLNLAGIKKVTPESFLYDRFDEAVYTQLESKHLFYREGIGFDPEDYHRNPANYKSAFEPYTRVADIFINGIYWDKRIPVFFTIEQMRSEDFRIRQIADITCDIAPESSVPSTVKASTIENPYYGFNPHTASVTEPFKDDVVDVMAIDNLPNELPRDASEDFGNMLINRIIPKVLVQSNPVIQRATIIERGNLTEPYNYLKDYAGVQ
ncbi:MAG: alanine dehydrogenase, partial [Chitinophagales bacterium]|nr:alanine dehydrogenase [Chitinophagales bacterium]